MRHKQFALATTVSLLLLAACQTAEKAATTVKSAGQAQVNPTLSTADATFINAAGTAGIEEVKFGQLAEQKATTRAIRAFATQMVTDHTTANDKLIALANAKQMTPPSSMDTMHDQAYSDLDSTRGRAFNKLYMDGQVADHEQVVEAFKGEVQNGTDPDVTAFARQMLPILERHLQMAKRIDPKN
jgi:putative membrane protein